MDWASEKITPTKCFDLLAMIKGNQATGKGPCTLAEIREQAEDQKKAKAKAKAALAQQTFKAFFNEIFFPYAKTRWKKQTAVKAEQHTRTWIDPVTGVFR